MHAIVNTMAVIGALTVASAIALVVLAVIQYKRNGWNG